MNSSLGRFSAPQTQKKYVGGRGGREGEWVTSGGEVEKEGYGGRPRSMAIKKMFLNWS